METFKKKSWQPEKREAANDESDDEREAIRRKKLRILRDGDWLGLEIQKPVKLKYAPTGREDNIGRRRRLKPNEHARYDKKQSHISPNLRPRNTQSEVRVCIDGKERRVGASSTAPSRATQPLSCGGSDIMLLDNSSVRDGPDNPQLSNEMYGGQSLENDLSGTYQAGRLNGDLERAPINHHHRHKIHTDSTPVRRRDSRHSHSGHAPLLSSNIKRMAEQRAAEDLRRSFEKVSYMLTATDGRSSKARQEPVHEAEAPQPGRLIFRSSPPPLHHPTPRSSHTSTLLRSDSSEIIKSIAATIGLDKRLSAKEQKEDEMWKNWLDDDGGRDDRTDEEQGNELNHPQISPGISAYAPPRLGSSIEPSVRESARASASTSASVARSKHPDSSLDENLQSTVAQPSNMPQLKKPSPNAAWKSFVLTSSTDDLPIRPHDQVSPKAAPLQQLPYTAKTQHKKFDPDAAWKSFVVSESDNEDDKTAFGSFWKRCMKPKQPVIMKPLSKAFLGNQSSGQDSLLVHTSGATTEPELPFSRQSIHTPLKGAPHVPSEKMFVASDNNYRSEAETRVLDDRSMYANTSGMVSTSESELPFTKPSIHITPRKAQEQPTRQRRYGALLLTSEDEYAEPHATSTHDKRPVHKQQSLMANSTERSQSVAAATGYQLLDPFKEFFAKTGGRAKPDLKGKGRVVEQPRIRSIYDIPSDGS